MRKPVETVQFIYQSFGSGNVPAILGCLSPTVAWESWPNPTSVQSARHPVFQERHGAAEVGGFFQAVAENLDISDFQVRDLLGNERMVVALIGEEYTHKRTGRKMRDESIHLWTFDAEGQVAAFRHYIDTGKHLAAAGLALP